MQVIILLIAALFSSCASSPPALAEPLPDWVSRGIETVYPSVRYIAETGSGSTREAAQADALAQISRYFNVQVSASVHDLVQESNGALNESIRVDTLVNSNTRLFAVHYAESYYDARHKEYRAAAYIDREEAWAIFALRIVKEADAFRALWRQTEAESEGLKKLLGYKALLNYYVGAISFGEVLHPAKMAALIADTRDVREMRENGAALPAKIYEMRGKVSIFIECEGDHDSIIAGTLTSILSADGLPAAKSKNNASAICAVTIIEGYQKLDAGHFYTPRVNITISDKKGAALFSYSASAAREGSPTNADVAKRRAYNALAKALESNFIAEWNR